MELLNQKIIPRIVVCCCHFRIPRESGYVHWWGT